MTLRDSILGRDSSKIYSSILASLRMKPTLFHSLQPSEQKCRTNSNSSRFHSLQSPEQKYRTNSNSSRFHSSQPPEKCRINSNSSKFHSSQPFEQKCRTNSNSSRFHSSQPPEQRYHSLTTVQLKRRKKDSSFPFQIAKFPKILQEKFNPFFQFP